MKEENNTPQAKQLFYVKLQTAMIAVILILILIFVLFMTVKVGTVMGMLEQIDLAQVNAAVASLKTAADQIAQVDMETLNDAIASLSTTAESFSELDFTKLTGFLDSLEGLSTEMDNVSGVLKALFGR